MRASFFTAGLMTALVFVAAPTPYQRASAADLEGEAYAGPPYDERYDDQQGYEEGASHSYRETTQTREYEESYGTAERPGSIKDGYPVPMPAPRAEAPPPRYVERPPVHVERYACLERWQIRKRLRNDGWAGIRPMGGDGEVVNISARRFDTGRPFRLRVDRCSGAVLAARPEYLRSFAYQDRPWHRY